MALNYRQAGVDIAAGEKVVENIKKRLKQRNHAQVLQGVGGFAAVFDLHAVIKGYHAPVLVQSVDGVGTKSLLAAELNEYSELGADLFAAVCNDVAVVGAKVVTFLDYLAQSQLQPEALDTVIARLIDCCHTSNVALVGGETAEMPGVYAHPHSLELVGVASGVLEREECIDGHKVQAGELIFGLSSSGLHTNGYSLIRKIFFEKDFAAADLYSSELGMPLAEALLKAHHNYLPFISSLLERINITAMAHITGGGIFENLKRVLPTSGAALLKRWSLPPLFQLIHDYGKIDLQEMYHTFNMGVGLVVITAEKNKETLLQQADEHALECYPLGHIEERKGKLETVQWQS